MANSVQIKSPSTLARTYSNKILNTADELIKTFTSQGVKISLILSDFYTTNGLFCLVRLSTSYMDMLSLIPSINGLFKEALHDLNLLKPLYSATMLPVLADSFFRKDNRNNFHFQLPRNPANGKLDSVKLLFCIGGLCDTLEYIHKIRLLRIELFTTISNKISPTLLFTLNGVEWRVDNTPLLNSIFQSTKEIFFLTGSAADVFKWVYVTYKAPTAEERAKQFELEPLLKLTMSLSRCILLGFSRIYKGSVPLKIVNFVMQHAATFNFVLKNEQERRKKHVFVTVD